MEKKDFYFYFSFYELDHDYVSNRNISLFSFRIHNKIDIEYEVRLFVFTIYSLSHSIFQL